MKSGEKQLKPANSQNKIISCVLISVTKAFGHHVLLLPATILRTPTNSLTYTACTREVKLAKLLETVDFKLGRSNRQLLLLFDRLSDVMIWFLSLDCMSDCRLSRNLTREGQQLHALLLSTGLL